MSRRLGQGVVTGLDRSFISTVATYFELPVMLMSFFSGSIKYDDGFLGFVLVVFDYRKKAIYYDEAINVVKNRLINLTSPY